MPLRSILSIIMGAEVGTFVGHLAFNSPYYLYAATTLAMLAFGIVVLIAEAIKDLRQV